VPNASRASASGFELQRRTDPFPIAERAPFHWFAIGAICQSTPTVIDINLERPAVLGALVASAAAIVANYLRHEVERAARIRFFVLAMCIERLTP
jgi:hypothetical protein